MASITGTFTLANSHGTSNHQAALFRTSFICEISYLRKEHFGWDSSIS